MHKSAKRYFDWAYEYQIAALMLHTQIAAAPYLFNPIIFLLRHTIELLLKGLIIGEVKQKSNTRIDEIKVGKQNRKLNQTHSLLELWDKYTFVASDVIRTDDFILVDKVIKMLNRKDPYSDRYRYPQSKQKHNFATEPVQLDCSGKSPDIDDGIPYVLITDGVPAVINKGPILLQDLSDIIEVTEILFDCSEK